MRTSRHLRTCRALLSITALLSLLGTAEAQMFGARADGESLKAASAETLAHDAVKDYITIEGKVEKRLNPTALRIVLALTVDRPTASECQNDRRKLEGKLLKDLDALGIGRGAIDVDFISILPMYKWETQTDEADKKVAVEKKSGFRMQSNVHVQVATEELAGKVLDAAFKSGISDVIAFDYWNKDVDRHKNEARREALKVATVKANLLLGSMFGDRPRPINVHESTRVIYPRSLYASFENSYSQQLSVPYSGKDPTLKAARPKNTYYRGLLEQADVHGPDLALGPQISVVSTVRLYYATPGPK